MSNPLLSLLDIDYPLIQAPMAGVSTPALAAAVSNAGATPGGKPTGQQHYVPILPAMAVRHRIR